MKRLKKCLLKIAFNILQKELKKNKKLVIKKVNDVFDLEGFSEEEESEMIEAIYDALVEIGKIVLEKKL